MIRIVILVLAVHFANFLGAGGGDLFKFFFANSDNFSEDWNGIFIIVSCVLP